MSRQQVENPCCYRFTGTKPQLSLIHPGFPHRWRCSVLQRLMDVNEKPLTLKAAPALLGPNADLHSAPTFSAAPESKPRLPSISPASGVGIAVTTGVVTDSTRVAGSPIPAHLGRQVDGLKREAEVRSRTACPSVPPLVFY